MKSSIVPTTKDLDAIQETAANQGGAKFGFLLAKFIYGTKNNYRRPLENYPQMPFFQSSEVEVESWAS